MKQKKFFLHGMKNVTNNFPLTKNKSSKTLVIFITIKLTFLEQRENERKTGNREINFLGEKFLQKMSVLENEPL